MGCCISQPESDIEPVSSRISDNIGSPSVPPPQYNEQQEFVLDAGKTKDQVDGESSGIQDEKQSSFPSSSSFTTTGAATKETSNNNNQTTTTTHWPIFIRSSMSGKDIPVDLPGTAPFWTVHQLRQHIEPQLATDTNHSPLRIRFIYLGKILSDTTTLIPSAHTSTCDSLLIDKHAVIQAMVSTIT
ncbi:hypothetical protein BC941DRAFT_513776 [Chlamydoabsidia padenii]|nr:hypothetical protein BC941DRAFT_513776 [Chlamydoabsidia padenii]